MLSSGRIAIVCSRCSMGCFSWRVESTARTDSAGETRHTVDSGGRRAVDRSNPLSSHRWEGQTRSCMAWLPTQWLRSLPLRVLLPRDAACAIGVALLPYESSSL
jgi:hypothetical protein